MDLSATNLAQNSCHQLYSENECGGLLNKIYEYQSVKIYAQVNEYAYPDFRYYNNLPRFSDYEYFEDILD